MLAVATEAMRRAANGAALCARVEANAGVRLHIIDGPTEAALAFLAVRMRYPVGALVAVDIGGGSTEIAYGGAERPEVAVSLPAGAVLYGRYGLDGVTDAPTLERVRAEVDRLLAASSLPPGTIGAGSGVRALGTSGSIQRCARLLKARDGEPGDSPDGRLITRDDLSWLVAALAGRSLEARRAMPGMDPERADILLAGALILERVGVFLGVETWQVATTGLRTALAAIALGAAPPPAGLTLDARMDARLIDSVG